MIEKLLKRVRGAAPACAEEGTVLGALGNRPDDPALAAHLEACPHCAEAVRVATWMQALAAEELVALEPLPDVERLWVRAELAELWEAERRAAAPVETVERAEPLLLVVAIAVLATLAWPMVERWLAVSPPPAMTRELLGTLVPLGAGGLLLAALLFLLRPLLTGGRQLV